MIIMKAATSLTPLSFFAVGGALNKRKTYLSILCLIIVTLAKTHSVTAAPAKLDSLESTFPLELQPPIFEATIPTSASPPAQSKGNNDATTIDSYGNPIESLQPINTPDGRKVVSAQGLQFEIPNYASGITELKKPADDLLPPFIDKIGSSGEEVITKSSNPFLRQFDDGKYKRNPTTGRTTTTTSTTSTTTTTTTPAPEIVEENPFEPTLPPWLRDLDYPDLAPGVPFVYDPNENENPVDENILPPSKTEDSNNANLSPNSPFLNSQMPQAFTNKFTSSAKPLTFSSIPSIVTNPLPSTQSNQDRSQFTRPSHVLEATQSNSSEDITRSNDISKKTSSIFNQNFAAPFEPSTDADQKKPPLSVDRESFPPFNNVITSSSPTISNKTTFSKSEDGKVITNNIFLNGGIGSTSAKPTGATPAAKSQERTTLATQSTFIKGTSSSLDTGFKYTGRFGGPPGILAPEGTELTGSSSIAKPVVTTFEAKASTGLATNHNDKFQGSFGGPPGVLKPFDNLKNR